MTVQTDSPAVAIARAHAAAYNHDYETARDSLATDVRVTASSTLAGSPNVQLTGVDEYMVGLRQFADLVVPGSLRVVGSVGDERNALLLLTVEATGGPWPRGTLAGARLYQLDDRQKISAEQVIFFITPHQD